VNATALDTESESDTDNEADVEPVVPLVPSPLVPAQLVPSPLMPLQENNYINNINITALIQSFVTTPLTYTYTYTYTHNYDIPPYNYDTDETAGADSP